MNVYPNYANKTPYRTAKYPIRQPRIITWLIWALCKLLLANKQYKVEKRGMEGLRPPYLLLSNHMYFIDFMLAAVATFPHRVNNVVTIDGYYRRPWLMELIGSICTLKFTNDLHLVKSIRKVLQRGDVLCMYPEARYSPCGVTSYLPESLGKLVRMNKVPVVAVVHHGNHLHTPFWNWRKARRVPLHTTVTQVLTAEQAASMSVEEINAVLKKALEYDEYRYQEERGIRITEPHRAEGLHKILYHCPCCGAQSRMASAGTRLSCTACGRSWELLENGRLQGEGGFERIPDWFAWEREQVRAEIEAGEYRFEDEVEVYSLPRCWRFEKLGRARLTHSEAEGFVLEGHYRGADWRICRTPAQTNSLHIEYDYCYLRPEDCVDISTEQDSFYCYPTRPDVVTKLAFATEILYERSRRKGRQARAAGAAQ